MTDDRAQAPVKEILPGVWHWMAMHPKIGFPVSSYYVAESGTVLDPMVPPAEGLAWFGEERGVQWLALTNRHHDREADRYCAEFDLGPVLVPESGLHEFEDKPLDVRSYAPGEEIIPGILVHEVGAICPDDMALEIRSAGALAMADALVHFEDGVRFVRDSYMDDPPETKRKLAASLDNLLDVDFDTLLFAHGEPIVGGGKQVLRDFLATNPGG
jgi:glyoxylase-like metal-dependent hydrolase (beta-lactamase superfamily II)